MATLDIVDRLLSRARLELHPDRCLRRRHRSSTCRLCLDSCPVGAVGFDEVPSIDYSLCRGCGVCANLCPTDVFRLKAPTYRTLLAEVKGKSAVEVTCSLMRHDRDAVVVPCLGYLNEAVLVGAVVQGVDGVILNVSGCPQCTLGSGLPVTRASLWRANRLLTLFGLASKVSARTDEPGRGYGPEDSKHYSRRELFSYLGRGAREAVTGAGTSLIADGEVAASSRRSLQTGLPEKRSLLLNCLKRLGPPSTRQTSAEGLPFARVDIGEDCDGCGMCITFCPTGALGWHDEEKKKTMIFSAGYCLACNLCRDVCPRDSIALLPEISLDDIVADTRITLREYSVSICTGCGRRCIGTAGSGLCPGCMKKDSLRRWLAGV